MSGNIQTLEALKAKAKQNDPYEEAFTALTQRNTVIAKPNLKLVDDILTEFKGVATGVNLVENLTPGNPFRNIEIIDKDDNLLFLCENIELKDGKLYVRRPYEIKEKTQPESWMHYFFARLYRTPPPTIEIKTKIRK